MPVGLANFLSTTPSEHVRAAFEVLKGTETLFEELNGDASEWLEVLESWHQKQQSSGDEVATRLRLDSTRENEDFMKRNGGFSRVFPFVNELLELFYGPLRLF